MSSIGWGFPSADVAVFIGAGFQTGVYKSFQSPTERFNAFKRLEPSYFFAFAPLRALRKKNVFQDVDDSKLNQRSVLNH